MPSELPCVWMSAGVLTYRLCDRELDCDRCPLHLALTGGPFLNDGGTPIENLKIAERLDRLEALVGTLFPLKK